MISVENYNSIEEVLAEKGWFVSTISGVSMYPMLRNRKDQILVKPVEGRLKPYDVALYHVGGSNVAHRVLEDCGDHYVIRGDNCMSKEIVPCADVVGVVTGFWRRGRFIEVTDRRYLRYARFWVAVNPLVRLAHYPRIIASKIYHWVCGNKASCL